VEADCLEKPHFGKFLQTQADILKIISDLWKTMLKISLLRPIIDFYKELSLVVQKIKHYAYL